MCEAVKQSSQTGQRMKEWKILDANSDTPPPPQFLLIVPFIMSDISSKITKLRFLWCCYNTTHTRTHTNTHTRVRAHTQTQVYQKMATTLPSSLAGVIDILHIPSCHWKAFMCMTFWWKEKCCWYIIKLFLIYIPISWSIWYQSQNHNGKHISQSARLLHWTPRPN